MEILQGPQKTFWWVSVGPDTLKVFIFVPVAPLRNTLNNRCFLANLNFGGGPPHGGDLGAGKVCQQVKYHTFREKITRVELVGMGIKCVI